MIGEGLPQFLMDGEDIEGQEGGEWHFWTHPSAISNGIIVWLLILLLFTISDIPPCKYKQKCESIERSFTFRVSQLTHSKTL